jgi:WD40 repeat protein
MALSYPVSSRRDAATGACERLLEGHGGGVSSVVALDEQHVVSASWDRTLRLWDITKGVCERVFAGHTGGVYCIALVSPGRVVSVSYDETLRVWVLGPQGGQCRFLLQAHTAALTAVAVQPTHKMAASASSSSACTCMVAASVAARTGSVPPTLPLP